MLDCPWAIRSIPPITHSFISPIMLLVLVRWAPTQNLLRYESSNFSWSGGSLCKDVCWQVRRWCSPVLCSTFHRHCPTRSIMYDGVLMAPRYLPRAVTGRNTDSGKPIQVRHCIVVWSGVLFPATIAVTRRHNVNQGLSMIDLSQIRTNSWYQSWYIPSRVSSALYSWSRARWQWM